MKNEKDRAVVLLTYGFILVLIFSVVCAFMPDYIMLKEHALQYSIVFGLGVLLGVLLGEVI